MPAIIPTDVDLRLQYRNTLIRVASEIGSVDRSALNAVALGRIRSALGVGPVEPTDLPEKAVRERVFKYLLALKTVLQEMAQVDTSAANQAAVADVERELMEALQ